MDQAAGQGSLVFFSSTRLHRTSIPSSSLSNQMAWLNPSKAAKLEHASGLWRGQCFTVDDDGKVGSGVPIAFSLTLTDGAAYPSACGANLSNSGAGGRAGVW